MTSLMMGEEPSSGGKDEAAATACGNYRLDMTAAHFGDCKCGFSKAAHRMDRAPSFGPTTSCATSISARAASFSTHKAVDGSSVASRAASFGQCGGSARASIHQSSAGQSLPAAQVPGLRKKCDEAAAAARASSTTSANDSRRACNDYQIDMTAARFGDCKCGFAKVEHGTASFARGRSTSGGGGMPSFLNTKRESHMRRHSKEPGATAAEQHSPPTPSPPTPSPPTPSPPTPPSPPSLSSPSVEGGTVSARAASFSGLKLYTPASLLAAPLRKLPPQQDQSEESASPPVAATLAQHAGQPGPNPQSHCRALPPEIALDTAHTAETSAAIDNDDDSLSALERHASLTRARGPSRRRSRSMGKPAATFRLAGEAADEEARAAEARAAEEARAEEEVREARAAEEARAEGAAAEEARAARAAAEVRATKEAEAEAKTREEARAEAEGAGARGRAAKAEAATEIAARVAAAMQVKERQRPESVLPFVTTPPITTRTHDSRLATRHSPLTTHHSPLTTHHSPGERGRRRQEGSIQ